MFELNWNEIAKRFISDFHNMELDSVGNILVANREGPNVWDTSVRTLKEIEI